MLLDVVASGLSSPTNSGLGVAASSLSPVASYEIGQYFKEKGTEGSSAHILAHTLLGAAVAAAGGNDALTAGLAAGGAEAAAPVLSNYLYGKKASDLTAEEKSTISAITGLVATGIGGVASGDIATAVQSGQGAQNAVENNTTIQDIALAKVEGKTLGKKAEELVKAERLRKCGAVGLSASSETCNQYLRKETQQAVSNTLSVISDGSTGAAVSCMYAVACAETSPLLFSVGKFTGWGATVLDTEKSWDQKVAEIVVSGVTGKASEQALVKVPDISKAVKKTHEEVSSKLGEKAVDGVYECKKNPNQIGCKNEK